MMFNVGKESNSELCFDLYTKSKSDHDHNPNPNRVNYHQTYPYSAKL